MDSDGQDSGRAIPRCKEATMKKISREECYQTALVNLWNHIDALQKEVEWLERVGSERKAMTVDQIRAYMSDNHSFDMSIRLAEEIQPLTVQQGFVPEWSKAPLRATEWACGFLKGPEWCDEDTVIYIPRPSPKTREKDRDELLEEFQMDISKKFGWIPNGNTVWQFIAEELADGKPLKDLCRAAGISLTVTEE